MMSCSEHTVLLFIFTHLVIISTLLVISYQKPHCVQYFVKAPNSPPYSCNIIWGIWAKILIFVILPMIYDISLISLLLLYLNFLCLPLTFNIYIVGYTVLGLYLLRKWKNEKTLSTWYEFLLTQEYTNTGFTLWLFHIMLFQDVDWD